MKNYIGTIGNQTRDEHDCKELM